MHEKGVSGFPVVDPEGRLVGMVTSRDMWYIENDATPVSEMMTPRDRLITGTPKTKMEEALKILYTHRIEKLPLIDDQGRLAGLITKQDIIKTADVHLRRQGRQRPAPRGRRRRRGR